MPIDTIKSKDQAKLELFDSNKRSSLLCQTVNAGVFSPNLPIDTIIRKDQTKVELFDSNKRSSLLCQTVKCDLLQAQIASWRNFNNNFLFLFKL
jgi:hypothetical protein